MGSCMGGGAGSEGMRRSYRGTLNGVCIQLRCFLHILRQLNSLHKEKSGPIKTRFPSVESRLALRRRGAVRSGRR